MLNHLDAALEKFNSRVHKAICMTPFETSTTISNNRLIYNLIPSNNIKSPKFQVEDFVRNPDRHNFCSKSYTTNWNREHFKIQKVDATNPVTFVLEDDNTEELEGRNYEHYDDFPLI